jgi:hypothetical protein
MSLTNSAENSIALLIFNATAWANIADNAASGPLTNLYVSFHTADPGEGGSQTTSETSYGSYARVAVARSGSGWTVTGNSVSPAANVDAPQCTSLTATLTHFGIGSASSGAGVLIGSGTLTPNISVSSGVTPRLSTSTTITFD